MNALPIWERRLERFGGDGRLWGGGRRGGGRHIGALPGLPGDRDPREACARPGGVILWCRARR